MDELFLAINCGSSSLKYAVFDAAVVGQERDITRGHIDRIGADVPDHAAAVNKALDDLERRGIVPTGGVGHRLVHGADRTAPALVDDELLAALDGLVSFAPLHLPPEIRAIRAVVKRWPGLRQVACFDTAFHRTLSEVAQRYAVPAWVHDLGVRRYGFHGLSYEYVVDALGAGALGRAVVAHLGSGASMAAIHEGKAVDTTMGFTPSGGLVMGTRTGDLDPGILIYLAQQGRDAKSLDDLVNRNGGLLGISGSTADVRDLLKRRENDPLARLALDAFVWNARKWAGAMTASLGGIDTLVFTGGIGEHAAPIRAAIAQGLEHLGVCVDNALNARPQADGVISPADARCVVRVVATDEERMVARHTARVLARLPQ